MPAAGSPNSKTDLLARTRRNQQRCRDRKRAHVAELETQVEELRATLRNCGPCDQQSLPPNESALETAVRENDARRELLLALGFDEEAQQRFVESVENRREVYAVLNGREAGGVLSDSPRAQVGGEGPSKVNSSNAPTVVSDGVMDAPINGLETDVENWLLSPETLQQMDMPAMDFSGDMPWLSTGVSQPYNINGLIHEMLPPSSSGPDEIMQISAPATTDNRQSTTTPSFERCFLDTVVQVSSGETCTPCSKALAQIFRHNRQGLSMAELQNKLRAGMRPPSDKTGECHIEDSVLFSVLAEISTTRPS